MSTFNEQLRKTNNDAFDEAVDVNSDDNDGGSDPDNIQSVSVHERLYGPQVCCVLKLELMTHLVCPGDL